MSPCELNAAIASVCNILFTKLSKKDFLALSVVLSELSKSMFAMEVLRSICDKDKADEIEVSISEDIDLAIGD